MVLFQLHTQKKPVNLHPLNTKQEVKQGVHVEQMRVFSKIHSDRLVENDRTRFCILITTAEKQHCTICRTVRFPDDGEMMGNKRTSQPVFQIILQHYKKGQTHPLATAAILSFYRFNFICVLRRRLHLLIQEQIEYVSFVCFRKLANRIWEVADTATLKPAQQRKTVKLHKTPGRVTFTSSVS